MRRAFVLATLVASLASCGGGPRARFFAAVETHDVDVALSAYDTYRQTEGGDRALLGHVAALVLAEEARSDEPERRRAAITQLGMAGTLGEPVLVSLANEHGTSPGRLDALLALSRRGREPARLTLRALADHQDPEILAAAIHGMDPELDRALLLEHLAGGAPEVRVSAATVLGRAAESEDVRVALATQARVDDAAEVRAACVRSLGGAGPEALDALRERLSDPAASVRLAAVTSLMRTDARRGAEVLAPLLSVDPNPAAVEAARLLAGHDTDVGAEALRFLQHVLTLGEPALRSQAAVALTGLPRDRTAPLDAVLEALEREPDAGVRLQLARALMRPDARADHQGAARQALERLLGGPEGIVSVQAAAILAAGGHVDATGYLRAALAARESMVRRTAARALAREALEPESVRGLLRDDDALVRIYAAGGILAAAAAG